MTLEEFFCGFETSRSLYDALSQLIASVGPSTVRVTRSQVAFARRRTFAWAWVPRRYLLDASTPLVLSVALDRHDDSDRWKEVVEPAPGRFMHHLELHQESDLDSQVRAWLAEAWSSSG
jgi:hypothetical protein